MLANIPPSLGAVPANPRGMVYNPIANPLLTQVTIGQAPVLEPPWWQFF